jgi:hypothetical protein
VAAVITDTFIDVIGIVATNAPVLIDTLCGMVKTVISTALARVREDPEGFVRTVGDIIAAIIGGVASFAIEIAPQLGATLTSLLSNGINAIDNSTLGETFRVNFESIFGGDISPDTVANFASRTVNALANGLAPALEEGIPALATFMADFAAAFTSEENLAGFGTAASTIFGALCNGIGTAAANGDVETFVASIGAAVAHIIAWLTSEE